MDSSTPPTHTSSMECDAPTPPTRRRGLTALAWLVIAAMIVAAKVADHLEHRAAANAPTARPDTPIDPENPLEATLDPVGVMLMELQAKYMVAAADLNPGTAGMIYAQAAQLNVGSIDQRQRFIIMAAELAGAGEAAILRRGLEALVENPPDTAPPELTPRQARVGEILTRLFPDAPAGSTEAAESPSPNPASRLSEADRKFLVRSMGWFGRLALAPAGTDDESAREAVLAPARQLMWMVIGAVIAAAVAGLAGFAGLITLIVLAFTGRIRSGMAPSAVSHGLYAETFAVWMVVFLVFQYFAGLLPVPQESALLAVALGFFVSLLALAWPVLRGASWSEVRRDIGWTSGPAGGLEPLVGIGGYLMTLPILGVGLLITVGFFYLDTMLRGTGPTFGSSAGPAHPIVAELAGGSWMIKGQILFLAVVAAPIVEETMFRGVLYRHLRQWSARWGFAASVMLAALISSFVFAAIHPQGWVAIPALMSLAIAMALMREWRGSLVPSMMIHGISNGLVMGLLMVLLGI
jgi:membrane protease YdiL (CAAX protease family)